MLINGEIGRMRAWPSGLGLGMGASDGWTLDPSEVLGGPGFGLGGLSVGGMRTLVWAVCGECSLSSYETRPGQLSTFWSQPIAQVPEPAA